LINEDLKVFGELLGISEKELKWKRVIREETGATGGGQTLLRL